jgi:hypothetical protein
MDGFLFFAADVLRSSKRVRTACALLLLSGTFLGAQNFPALEADSAAYGYAEKLARSPDYRNYWLDLAETAVWASTVNSSVSAAERGAYLEKIRSAAASLAASADLPRGEKERGEYILAFMHKNFLRSYSERQTRLDELLSTGRYNCVSSAVLYMIFAVSSGLEAGGVMTKDHAFATINAGGETIDVETTNPYGFDPGNRKEFHDGFGRATGFAYVPAKNYRDRTAINPSELISLILSNRVAGLEQGGLFAEAVPLGINRAALLSKNVRQEEPGVLFEDPRRDMMTRLYNYGAFLIRGGKDDEALAWATLAGSRFPDEAWQKFIVAAINNKAVRLIRSRKTAEARAALEAEKSRLGRENYRALDAMVFEAEIAEQLNAIKNAGEAEAVIARIAAAGEWLPGKILAEMRITAVLKEAERLGRAGDWQGALDWTDAAVERYGADSRLESARRTFRQNRIGELHNGFAALYNKKDLAGAKAFIEKALKEYPGERQLVQDQAVVERALGNR